jgi:argininosuccinate lyase
LTGLLTVLKGLPLSYNRDLQEDKHFVFDSADTVTASLKIMTGFMASVRFKREKMAQKADGDLTLLATDLADILVTQGIPFRRAHEAVGQVVNYCLEQGKRIQDLNDHELKKFSDLFPKGTAENLSVHHSVNQKKVIGGTSPRNVVKQAALLKKEILKLRKRSSL